MNELTTLCTRMLQYAVSHWYLLLLLMPIVGYLRSSVDGKKPPFLPDVSKLIKSWFTGDTWISRFSILFAIIIYPYVLLVWVVYGILSVFEFIAFLFRKLWWVVLWIWNEVLHPTVFAAFRLLWHYVLVAGWRFFHYSFLHIPESVKQNNILFAIRKLLVLAAISAPLIIIYLLTLHVVVLALFSIILFYLFQYTVFSSVAYYRGDTFKHIQVMPGLRISFLWLTFAVVATALIVLINQFADVFIVGSLGITFVQILMPLAVFFGISFVATSLYLPSYMAENEGEVDIIPFMRSMLFRLPKLIFAQPFQLIGFLVLSIIPFLLMMMLNTGVKEVSGMDYHSWIKHVSVMDYHLPQVIENNKMILEQQELILKADQDKSAVRLQTASLIQEKEAELAGLKALRDRIADDAIHTFDRTAYVGETQSFSVPSIEGCSEYEWTIHQVPNDNLLRREVVRSSPGSGVFYHRWVTPGVYTVRLSPRNACGSAATLSRQVQVEPLPVSQTDILKPSGPLVVCSGESATYTTQGGLNNYEWELPDGARLLTANVANRIVVEWGTTSGNVRVRAKDSGGQFTPWRGVYVNVQAVPGITIYEQPAIADDELQVFEMPETRYFVTREAGDYALEMLLQQRAGIEADANKELKAISLGEQVALDTIEHLKANSSDQIHMLLAKIVGVLGLLFIAALIASAYWTYWLTYHYDLWNAEQKGKHYWRMLLDELSARNTHQPLLGIFVLIILLVALYVLPLLIDFLR